MKRFAFILAALGAMPSYAVDEAALQAAVDGKHRTEAYTARDIYRNPVQTLTLFDIQPHHTVVEVWPGGGWYTEILAPYLKDKGRLIAAHYDSSDTQASYRPGSRARFEKKLADNKNIYGKVEVSSLTLDEEKGTLKIGSAKSGEADRVVTFRNLHGMASNGVTGAAMVHFFDILKPGGKLGIVQHMADPGQDWQAKNIGYVGRDYVIAEAEKAGFKLHAEGYFNHNEADTKDYAPGVWQLPPTMRGLKTDEEKAPYLAIGESERMTLVFLKPDA